MEINVEKIEKLPLNKLFELKNIINESVVEMSNNLTEYAMMHTGFDFKNMSEENSKEYNKLIQFQNLLSKVKEIINNKILKEYYV